jgi:glycosyltransferase involved in cell wall biosynthesis
MLHNPDLAQLPIGRDSETFTVGVLARLELVKDHATVLRAAAEVAHLRPKIRFLVVGSGSLLDPLRREAERLGVADSCEFAGHVSDVASVLARCHATVLASRSEGSPNAIIESFAAGVPVVATATQGSRELVRDGENGFLVPVGDATALAERLVTLADDEGLRRRLGITARREMLSTAAPEAIVRRYEGLYAALATNRVPDGHARR